MRWLAEETGRQPRPVPVERVIRTWRIGRNLAALARAAATIRIKGAKAGTPG